jgi:signal transduction histidine kinase
VERIRKPDSACVLAAAAAHDFNNELTVILSSVATLIEAMEPGTPALSQALDLQEAARRCARKSSGLLQFGRRRGARPLRTPLEVLIDPDFNALL